MMKSGSPNTGSAINKKGWQNLGNLTIERVITRAVALGVGLCKFNIRNILYSVATWLGNSSVVRPILYPSGR